ncbi:uncharacterized protein LOC126834551 [Adelges cooleyi]|uniref:uncharacterized protein LOC126834551 n=1 Tax=Adelges cooleyi TaxID=133065 RepID=UPI0021800CD5|nr:uncharacterized protein LOC126834551 [Adelges cooleyi]
MLIVHLISVMCLVSQYSHEDINREMEEICILKSQSERAFRLTSLMNDHWFLEDYIEHISNTFGYELFVILLDIYIQLLLCVYMCVWDYIVRSTNQDVYSVVSLLLHICIVSGNLFYLCYRCNATVKESRQVISKLHHLRDVLNNDSICQALLKVFTLRVNCREVHLTVLKLFNINLPLLLCSAGVVFTYFLVLIQFQIDGYKEILKEQNISDVTNTQCKSWPCVKKE